ncbi:uncharacterized protein LOC119667015 [Teleopsis dalmanni]|uniref:uncharacterized protein LOC119667015 n=1 Tax=Teleopsis dalmanni TaxID=139649 RepID=UPI0018CECA04|nr:uncharacterized protein LOC119667015 [Teleopsis dalmanni]
MYSAVRTYDYDYPESEMDDRESLYFDTISLADSEAAAAAAAHRKSLSQSRNTIYHSAVDLISEDTPSKRGSLRLENGRGTTARSTWSSPNYRHSSALEHYNNGFGNSTAAAAGDYTDAAIAAQILALQNGRGVIGSTPHMATDEVSRRLIQNSTNTSKDKKLPITYSQWKFRVKLLRV